MEREKTEYKDLVRKLNTWKYDEKIHREYYFMEKTPENIAKFEERHSGHCEFWKLELQMKRWRFLNDMEF